MSVMNRAKRNVSVHEPLKRTTQRYVTKGEGDKYYMVTFVNFNNIEVQIV